MIDQSDDDAASVGVQARRAFVGGTYWWSHAAVRGLFTVAAGEPLFFSSIDEAIAEAARCAGRVVAWSTRLTARQEDECNSRNIKLVRIEDGFIRSVGLGAGFTQAASLAVDARGIYYDPSRPSDIEHLLEHSVITDEQRAEGARIRQRIVELRLSKYNLSGTKPIHVNAGAREIILVPGQVADDASVLNSMSSTINVRSAESINLQLLRQARTRNPDACLIYKPHPDVLSGLRKGQLSRAEARGLANVVVEDVDITSLIEMVDGVETLTSLVGFEALVRGKCVTTHGVPFYAGWGLTNDLSHVASRTARRSIDELCYIALVQYTRHIHPVTGQACTIHELLDALDVLRSSRLHQWRIGALRIYARLCEFRAK